ncbi:MAG: DoxX family membrane protein [Patescibacteria group bacterium]
MKISSFNVLRVGLAITFLWVGVLILQSPEAWTGFIKPWAADLLITTPEKTMIGTAIFDIVVGFLLLIDFFTFWASVLAAIHLFIVLIVSGIDVITVRDIGLLAGAMAVAMRAWPDFADKN